MTKTFKKGDKVRVISAKSCEHLCGNPGPCEYIGLVGVIKEIPYASDLKRVYVFPFNNKEMGCSGFEPKDLEPEVFDWDV